MFNRAIVYGALQLLVAFFITIYVESVSNGKLLFVDSIFSENFSDGLLDNPIWVLLTLGGVNLLIYVLSHRDKTNKEMANLYKNICKLVFDGFIKKNANLENSRFRVVFFRAFLGLHWDRNRSLWPKYETFLKDVGRHQTRHINRRCKVKFLPEEGAVGISYHLGQLFVGESVQYSKQTEELYYKEQISKFNLPLHKVKKLHDQPCSFVCCPIKFFNSDDIYGVIVVDCLDRMNSSSSYFDTIEDSIHYYSAFFNKNDKGVGHD